MRRWVGLLMIALATLTACSRVAPTVRPDPVPSYDADAHLRQQALDALGRWDATLKEYHGPVFLPVGPLYGQLGEWEPGLAGANSAALAAGEIIIDGDLPGRPAETASVQLADGTAARLPMLSARDALPGAGLMGCGGCEPLRVTGARLDLDTIATTRGPATVPTWEYILAGTSVRLSRPAVVAPPVPLTPPPWDSAHPPAGMHYDLAVTTVPSRAVTVRFTGARDGADVECGIDYIPEAVESATAVVIMLHERFAAAPAGHNSGCGMVGYPRMATVLLTRPLGERTILDEQRGLPVPTVRLAA